MSSALFWKAIALALAISIFIDSVKHKRVISGLIWAIVSYFLPFIGFLYWSFGRNTQIHTKSFRQTSGQGQKTLSQKKLCSKCGTENAAHSTHCSQCGNKLTL